MTKITRDLEELLSKIREEIRHRPKEERKQVRGEIYGAKQLKKLGILRG